MEGHDLGSEDEPAQDGTPGNPTTRRFRWAPRSRDERPGRWLSHLVVPIVALADGLGAITVGLNTARQGRWGLADLCALVVATCMALAAAYSSPLGQALTTWRTD